MKLLSKNAISIILGGKRYTIRFDDPRFARGNDLLDKNDLLGFVELCRSSIAKASFANSNHGSVVEEGKKVFYDLNFQKEGMPSRVEVVGCLADKIQRLLYYNLSLEPMELFMERICLNNDPQACWDTFDFLSYKELPITARGTFLGYKGIGNNCYSIMGNTSTRVLQGTTDETGHILNRVGDTIEIEREDVCSDRHIHCGPGLHIGSLSYARGWGQRTVIVEVDPADVVSVPLDYSCQKMRACKYRVVDDFHSEIMAPLAEVSENGSSVSEVERVTPQIESFTNRLLENVGKLASQGLDICTLSEVCEKENFELARTVLADYNWHVTELNIIQLNK